ncbi:hypothetical protein PMAYCL1PPCAC_12591, partial [Pristionchus mayeri]
ILLASTLVLSNVLSLPCPSGRVAVPSSSGYLQCTNSTSAQVCGDVGSCEIVSNPLFSKSQQICCIVSSLLCPDGQFMFGGRCYEESDLPTGDTGCTVDADCGSTSPPAPPPFPFSPDSARCLNSTCSCLFGQQLSRGSDGSMVCRVQQVLQQQAGVCQLGQVQVNGQCLSLAIPGSPCQSSQQCLDSSTCTNQRCTCSSFNAQINNGYCIVPSTSCSQTQTLVNGICMTYAAVNQQCVSNGQCVGGATCVVNMCTCPSNLSPMNGYCIPNPTQSSQCSLGQVSVNGQCVSLSAPGNQCVSPLQCIDRSTCSNSVCTCTSSGAQSINGYCLVPVFGCANTQTRVNNQCVSYSVPGSPCQSSEQCLGGSTCLSATCSCPQGTTSMNGYCITSNGGNNCAVGQVSVNGQCLNSVQLGAFCQAVQQCPANSICQGTCQCQSGYTNQNGQCVGGSSGGCEQGQVQVNGQCLSLAAPGSQCQSSLQCIDSSSCINQRCLCSNSNAQIINGYCLTPSSGCSQTQIRVNNQCLTFAQPGSPCQANEQCVSGSTCVNSVCTCPSGMTEMHKYCIGSSSIPSNPCQTGQVQVNGQCISLAAPGTSCQATAQCLDSSTCSNNLCSCSNVGSVLVSGYCVTPVNGCSNTQTLVNGQCASLASPGQQCQANQQCVAGATCTNMVCTCPSGRTSMHGYCVPTGGTTGGCTNGQVLINGVCVSKSPLGGQCQQAAQCGDNTQCTNGMCQCAFGYQQVLSSCIRSGDSSCQRGQVSVNGQCLSLVSPGFQCQSSLQCIDNSNCLNSICSCAATNMQALSGYCVQPGTSIGCGLTQARVNGQCVTFSVVGQSCVGTEQCVGGSTCINQLCTCPMERYSMHGYCLVDATTGGDNCNAITQVLVNGVCYNLVQPGQQCQVSQQCIGGGQCFNFVCQNGNGNGQCKTYQVSVAGQCYDTVSIGQQCNVQQQCINNANCLSNRCQCNFGFTFNGQACLSAGIFPTCSGLTVSTNGQCLQLVDMNQFCSSTPQCMGYSACSSSSCKCPFAYSPVNGVCRKTTSVNNCPTGQVMSPSGACLSMVGIGGSCQINEQCPSGASCALGRCTQGSSSDLRCNDPNKEVAMANGVPINCQVQLCPADAVCEVAQQQYVCCRPRNTSGGSGLCPSGQSVELLPSGSPKNCLLQGCSSGRVCQHSSTANQFVCCGSTFG